MSKRLGYETTHVMLNLERKLNKQMNADPEINKSALVNKLLRKYFEGKLCPRCFGDAIRMTECKKCAVEWIACRNEGCKVQTKRCKCSWDEIDGLPHTPEPESAPYVWLGDRNKDKE